MPVTLHIGELKYKDRHNIYHGVNAVAEKKLSDFEEDVDEVISSAQSAVNNLEAEKDTIAQTVASMAQLGTDTALSTAGMAADAKAAGDGIRSVEDDINDLKSALEGNWEGLADIPGYINASGNLTSSASLRCSDYIEVPKDVVGIKIYSKYTTNNGSLNSFNPVCVFFDADKSNPIAIRTDDDTVVIDSDGYLTYTFSSDLSSHKYVRFNQSSKSQDATNVYFGFSVFSTKPFDTFKDDIGPLYEYSGTFTAVESLHTGFTMQKNTAYTIVFGQGRTDVLNVYGVGNASNNYKRLFPDYDSVTFFNDDTERELYVRNPNGNLDTIHLAVYYPDAIALKSLSVPRLYRVSHDIPNSDYTSFTKCLFELKDDASPKIIEIAPGVYDLYTEYKELWDEGLLPIYTGTKPSTEYVNYCVWVPKNTHIIGKGIVKLQWMPDPALVSITPNQCKCISPLNIAASCTIENVQVYCKNGRYCLHNDGLGNTAYLGAVQKYINCKFFKYANDTDVVSGDAYGFSECTGFGIDAKMHHIYENCLFETTAGSYAFYGHSRYSTLLTPYDNPDILLTNCVMITNFNTAVKFGNSTSRAIHIHTLFNNCYFSNKIRSQLESSSSSQCANGFDMQFLGCGDVSVQINDTDNPYTPKAYNTTLTIVT